MNIDNLSYEQLIRLNRRIVERLKLMDHIHAHSEMMKFNVGERMRFQPSGRSEISGTVVKYNKKTVTLVTEQGERWNVDPSLLSPQSTHKTGSTSRANIIDIDEGQTA